MPIHFAYIDLSMPGLGVVAVFLSLTLIGIIVNVVYLTISKQTKRRCDDAVSAAIVAGLIGNMMPTFGLIDFLRRGVSDRVDFIIASTCGGALLLNTLLSISVIVVARKQRSRIAEE